MKCVWNKIQKHLKYIKDFVLLGFGYSNSYRCEIWSSVVFKKKMLTEKCSQQLCLKGRRFLCCVCVQAGEHLYPGTESWRKTSAKLHLCATELCELHLLKKYTRTIRTAWTKHIYFLVFNANTCKDSDDVGWCSMQKQVVTDWSLKKSVFYINCACPWMYGWSIY